MEMLLFTGLSSVLFLRLGFLGGGIRVGAALIASYLVTVLVEAIALLIVAYLGFILSLVGLLVFVVAAILVRRRLAIRERDYYQPF